MAFTTYVNTVKRKTQVLQMFSVHLNWIFRSCLILHYQFEVHVLVWPLIPAHFKSQQFYIIVKCSDTMNTHRKTKERNCFKVTAVHTVNSQEWTDMVSLCWNGDRTHYLQKYWNCASFVKESKQLFTDSETGSHCTPLLEVQKHK
jgi:hypothetical protein